MLKKINNIALAAYEWMMIIGFVVMAVLVFFIFCKSIVEPLAPIVTFLVVLGCTMEAWTKKYGGVLSSVGIVLYILSWKVAVMYGPWPAVATYGVGMLIWGYAVFGLKDTTYRSGTVAA